MRVEGEVETPPGAATPDVGLTVRPPNDVAADQLRFCPPVFVKCAVAVVPVVPKSTDGVPSVRCPGGGGGTVVVVAIVDPTVVEVSPGRLVAVSVVGTVDAVLAEVEVSLVWPSPVPGFVPPPPVDDVDVASVVEVDSPVATRAPSLPWPRPRTNTPTTMRAMTTTTPTTAHGTRRRRSRRWA